MNIFDHILSSRIIMDRVHYKVDGITNQNMKTQIKKSLEKVDGVNNVCVDVERATVEVITIIQLQKNVLNLA